MNLNPNCNGVHCLTKDGEVRWLPIGGSSNTILCKNCFRYEMLYRTRRNKEIKDGRHLFVIPAWQDLKIYEEEK